MKTNFKKTLAVLLAVLMLSSIFSVTAFAAVCTVTLEKGSASGSKLIAGIAASKLTIKTASNGKFNLPDEAYFEREGYVQDGWTTDAKGAGTRYDFGASRTARKDTTYYPYWKNAIYNFSFSAGSNYNPDDAANYTDSSMTVLKSIEFEVNIANNDPVVFPRAMFTRKGYTQTGWSTSKTNDGTGTKYEFGSTYDKSKITKDMNFYPFWEPVGYVVEFVGGANGIGTAQSFDAEHNATLTAPGAIFTREGYTQIGWSTVEDSEVVEVELNESTPAILGDTVYYPVWRKDVFAASIDKDQLGFGWICEDYAPVEAQTVTVTNNGNVNVEYTLPVSENFDITVKEGDLNLAPNASITFSIKPKNALNINVYSENIVISCEKEDLSFTVAVSLKVLKHSFGKYTYNNDATYTTDGSKTAECLNGCGTKNTVVAEGTMKKYHVDNNTAVGLSDSYIHHRTVRFLAYGSGMDAVNEKEVGKRFRPVSWHVNDEFNGEFTNGKFEDGYEVTFTHTVFGEYTLTINYVEEEYNDETKEWVATEVTDTKTFDYTVGVTAEEEQEIIRPNSILTLIFGIFQELLKLLGLGG